MSNLSMATGVARQYDYWATVTKRTWKASVFSSFLAPLFYVLAMGVLLGGFIEGDPARLEGATSYLDFIVPGLIAAHAMQTAVSETTYPVMGNFKWNKVYDSMLATPLTIPHVAAAHLASSRRAWRSRWRSTTWWSPRSASTGRGGDPSRPSAASC